eukprot:11219997-Lingulodinium_polyedra.AAC.1
MYSLPGTSHWLINDGCDGCHQQMVEAGNPSNAPNIQHERRCSLSFANRTQLSAKQPYISANAARYHE